MFKHKYKTASDLAKAVKAAAKKSDQDTGKAVEDFYRGRLLERVFSEEDPAFVLKGGRGMLARTTRARYTSDIDFLYKGTDINEAVAELKRLASIDLDDFLEFRFVSVVDIAEEQEYREGYRITFTPVLEGTKSLRDVSVDLVVDQVPSGIADSITPANRLDIKGLPVFDYLVYPPANAVADKVCATMQLYSNGRESSRVRDLVDLVIYAINEEIDGSELSRNINMESRLRKIDNLYCFEVPDSWYERYEKSFLKSAQEAKLPESYRTISEAEKLVKKCVDPAIAGNVNGLVWYPSVLFWK